MKRSKGYRQAAEKVDPTQLHTPLSAVRLARQTSPTKFDATVEVAMRLGIDPRKADQMVRGTVNLPHGTGKTARVLVFANAAKAEEARTALDVPERDAGAAYFVLFDSLVAAATARQTFQAAAVRGLVSAAPPPEEVNWAVLQPAAAARGSRFLDQVRDFRDISQAAPAAEGAAAPS